MTQQALRRSWSIVFGPPLPRILPVLTFITSVAPIWERDSTPASLAGVGLDCLTKWWEFTHV
ncbi:MAG TPA: hypothetical protein VEC02_00165 [Nitrososphaerales archaeon]|nr:hypothetical protein [Nitrososphaerales archaeon]